jgi:bleomycin hydrolase
MKIRIFALAMLFMLSNVANPQVSDSSTGYQFTPVIELKATPIEDQHRSGTCWSYATTSFFESEMLRMGKPEVNLSEMFVVWHTYSEKAKKYVRMHGNTNFGPGGAFHDVTWVMKHFGMVPEEVYDGLVIEEDKPIHGEMDEILKAHVDAVIKNKNRKLSPIWHNAFKDQLNNYLGDLPSTFDYRGKKYTPQSFVKDYMGLNANDYIEIGSFTHHPFYSQFIIEIPDNWMWGSIYNVPLNEMMEIIDYALENGYTVAWAADVSDKGFATKTKGIAVIPDADITDMTGSEISRWESLSSEEKESELYKFDKPGKEKTITQEMRQIDFDNYTSTDDHGMHIIGTAKDQNGTVYYKVKNSWGSYNDYGGYFYASKPYVALRTIDIMIHKDALPTKIAKKLILK